LDSPVSIVIEQNGVEKRLRAVMCWLRQAHSKYRGLGLELAGVELTDRGYLKVNERLQTTAPGVWAIARWQAAQFTHISIDDFRVVRGNSLAVAI